MVVCGVHPLPPRIAWDRTHCMSHIIIRKEWLIYIPRIASARTYPLLRFTNAC